MQKNLPKIRIELGKAVFMFTLLLAGLSFFTLQARDLTLEVTIAKENAKVLEVLDEIEGQTGLKFFYNTAHVDTERVVSLNVRKTPLDDVLQELFDGTEVAFSLRGNYIILSVPSGEEIAILNPFMEEGNEDIFQDDDRFYELKRLVRTLKMVTGNVRDENNEPLPGVTVMIKGKAKGTVTSISGKYSIDAESNDTLVFSFVGYDPFEVPVNGRSVIDIAMKISITSLQEVVVTSDGTDGYMDLPKERTTGSFVVVSAKEIEDVPAVSLIEKLEGKIPGVYFNTKANSIEIRGTNSYSKTPPLIVIDGFPMEQEYGITEGNQYSAVINYINPADIEKITVLKDAAASSIWGSRAANGVIVITTKKGKKSEPSVTFSTTLSMTGKQRLGYLDEMSTEQYIDYERSLVEQGFLFDPSGDWTSKNVSQVQQILFQAQRGEITQDDADASLAALAHLSNRDQIEEYLLQSSVSQQYNFAVSGGAINQNYYLSGNYTKDVPIYQGNEGKTYNFTFNHGIDLFQNRMKLNTGINYLSTSSISNNAARDALAASGSMSLRPYDMLVDENGDAKRYAYLFSDKVIDSLEALGYMDWRYSPIEELNYASTKNTSDNVRLTASLDTRITNWLNLKLSGMFVKNVSDLTYLAEEESYLSRDFINQATSVDSYSGDLIYGVPVGGTYYTQNGKKQSYDLRSQLSFNKLFAGNHQISMIAGAEIREETALKYSQTRYGYDKETNTSQSVNPTEYYTTVYGWSSFIGSSDGAVTRSRSRYLSYYSNASYGFKNKYFVSGSVRFDDYNLLGASRKQRALPLWSMGVKWNMKMEDFLSSADWLTMLSPRITYGKAGSAPAGGFGNSGTTINTGSTNYYTQLPFASIGLPANSRLKWETTKTLNFGLDFGFLGGRLNGTAELYFKKSEDILATMPFNATYGFSYLTYNTGSLEGHGAELGLTGVIIDGKDWNWTSVFNFGFNTNKVTDSRYEDLATYQLLSSSLKTGKPIDYLYAYQWAGLDDTGRALIYDENGELLTSTDYEVNEEALAYVGRTTPPYQGGFFQNVSYKNFSLNVQMTYYMGHKLRKRNLSNYPTFLGTYYGVVGRQSEIADRWKVPGDEEFTDVPGLANVDYQSVNRYNMSDLRIIDGDHVRLQQIAVGYSMPSNWVNKIGVGSLKINASVRNLGVIWAKNKDGLDPQYLGNGSTSYSDLPPSRNYMMSLQVTF